MTQTATAPASAAEQLERLSKHVEELADRMKAVGEQPHIHVHGDGDALSYWESDEEPSNVSVGQLSREQLAKFAPRRGRGRLPKGYKRQWGNDYPVGEFLKEFCKSENDGGSFLQKHREAYKAIQGLNESLSGDGGVLVVPEFSPRIFDREYSNDLWGRTDQYPVSGNTMNFPRLNETSRVDGSRAGGLRHYWVGEGADSTKSKPELGDFRLTLKKGTVLVYLTDEVMEDAPTLQQFVTKKVNEELEFMMGDAVVNGSGAHRPLGILNSPARVTVSKESGQLADTITAQNVIEMWSRLSPRSMTNAVWLINQDTYPQLFKMQIGTGTSGTLVFMPPQSGISGAPFGTIYGRPVIVTEFNPTLGDEGDIALWDPTQYVTIRKGGVAQAASIHVQFVSSQTALRFTVRVDGAPWENSPLTPYKGTATQSSIVTLAARA